MLIQELGSNNFIPPLVIWPTPLTGDELVPLAVGSVLVGYVTLDTLTSFINSGIVVNPPAVPNVDVQATIAATTVGTINPSGVQSVLVNMGSANTVLSVSPGYVGQSLRVEIKQGATPHTVSFDGTVVFSTDIPSFTATAVANSRDLIQLVCVDGTHWGMAAINKGFAL